MLQEMTREMINARFPVRYMNSSTILPSQHNAYNVCVEFGKQWFLEKFPENYFNSIYVVGKNNFDEFRKFSEINEQVKRKNPVMAMEANIDLEHNRDFIDSRPELPMLLRRSRWEESFFKDVCRGLYLQLIFKTILVTFNYKIRLNTKAEQLDMLEFIKIKHRAGFTESRTMTLDIHVPKEIIAQIAYDARYKIDDNLNVEDPITFLNYLNSHSLIPFVYKKRLATGNNEFFLRVPNCQAHLKMENPTADDGERDNMISTNFMVEMNVAIEMTAPQLYTYFSQYEIGIINQKPIHDDGVIAIEHFHITDPPLKDEHCWDKLVASEYVVEDEDLHKPLSINFNELFSQTELARIIQYTKCIAINPSVFLNFKIYNGGFEYGYNMDWTTMQCTLCRPIHNVTTVIAIYCDLEYIHNTEKYLDSEEYKTRVSNQVQ